MKNRTLAALLLLASPLGLFSSCKKDSDLDANNSKDPDKATTGSVSFTVQNVVPMRVKRSTATELRPLTLNVDTAVTAANEGFKVTTLEYYLSNFKFTKSDGSTYAAKDTYFLLNQATASTLTFTIPDVPVGDYTGVSFIVGVDAQKTGLTDPLTFTGKLDALNPSNNMYWTWNSGHIFMKVEGSVTSVTPNKGFLCHIGGYTAPYDAVVTTAPAFGSNKLTVQGSKTPTVALRANVVKLFEGPNPVILNSFMGAHMPNAQSVQIAQNYAAGMFTVNAINN